MNSVSLRVGRATLVLQVASTAKMLATCFSTAP